MLTRSSFSWPKKKNDCALVSKVPRVGASARKTTMTAIRQMAKLQLGLLTVVTNLTISLIALKKSLNPSLSKEEDHHHLLSNTFLEVHKTRAPRQMPLATRSWKQRWRYCAMRGICWLRSCTKPRKEWVRWRILLIMRWMNSMLLWPIMRALSKLKLAPA